MINALITKLGDQGVYLTKRGGAEGTRTPDPHTASVVRYQLRHGPAARLAAGTRAILHMPSGPPAPRFPSGAARPTLGRRLSQWAPGIMTLAGEGRCVMCSGLPSSHDG